MSLIEAIAGRAVDNVHKKSNLFFGLPKDASIEDLHAKLYGIVGEQMGIEPEENMPDAVRQKMRDEYGERSFYEVIGERPVRRGRIIPWTIRIEETPERTDVSWHIGKTQRRAQRVQQVQQVGN